MNILHFFIGFPEERHGGASKYVSELLTAQATMGHSVIALIPGDTLNLAKKTRIRKIADHNGINSYEIQNPPIAPLLFGLRNANYILGKDYNIDLQSVDSFYEEVKPDIFHIHTMMGLPLSLLKYIKSKGVKIVFTSHDYYGICPRVNLINFKGVICKNTDGTECEECNKNARPLWFLQIVNSKFFLRIKKYLPAIATKRKKRTKEKEVTYSECIPNSSDFIKLREYYSKMFSLFDAVHFNSSVSYNIYKSNYVLPKYRVIPITTGSISDNRTKRSFETRDLKMAFIGNLNPTKGYPLLKDILIDLFKNGQRAWKLSVWEGLKAGKDKECPNIIYEGRYKKEEIQEVFTKMDLLIVPSVCHETFSLVTLEALSFGTPVLVSKNVGAKMIIEDISPDFIVNDKEQLKNMIINCINNRGLLRQYNQRIVESNKMVFSMKDHAMEIVSFYKE